MHCNLPFTCHFLFLATMVKNLPAMQRPGFLGQEDPRDLPGIREWQPTLVFLPGKSHGQTSLVGYSSWGCKESDMTEKLRHTSWEDTR